MRPGGDLNVSVLRFTVAEMDERWFWVVEVGPAATFGRAVCWRPARLVTRYSHVTPRLAHLMQVGFFLSHFTLDAAHGSQLSRSLGAFDRGAEAGDWAMAENRCDAVGT
jgi:hypothetical protein